MVSRHPNIWKWLSFFALGLLLLGAFAPLSDLLGDILSLVGAAFMLIYSGALYRAEQRREREANRASSAAISSSDQN